MVQYMPTSDDEAEDEGEEVRFWKTTSVGASAGVSARRTTERVEDEPSASSAQDQEPVPVEDPDASDRDQWVDMFNDQPPPPSVKRKRKVRNDSVCFADPDRIEADFLKTKMHDWVKNVRQSYLNELVRLDGLGDSDDCPPCSVCGLEPGNICCMECSSSGMFCSTCAVESHVLSPLHRVEVSMSTTQGFVLNSSTGVARWLLPANFLVKSRARCTHRTRRPSMPCS